MKELETKINYIAKMVAVDQSKLSEAVHSIEEADIVKVLDICILTQMGIPIISFMAKSHNCTNEDIWDKIGNGHAKFSDLVDTIDLIYETWK